MAVCYSINAEMEGAPWSVDMNHTYVCPRLLRESIVANEGKLWPKQFRGGELFEPFLLEKAFLLPLIKSIGIALNAATRYQQAISRNAFNKKGPV